MRCTLDKCSLNGRTQLNLQEGFRVLVPDLYKGKLGVDAEEASHVSPHRLFIWVCRGGEGLS